MTDLQVPLFWVVLGVIMLTLIVFACMGALTATGGKVC